MLKDKRPEYVRCVSLELGDGKGQVRFETLCRKKAESGWCFTSIDHWLLHAETGGRLMLCPDCAERIREALKIGVWEE